MGAESMKAKGQGFLEQIGGRIKQALGEMFGKEKMEAKGRAEELHGHEEVERGETAERREGTMQEAAGAVKKTIGETLESERMAAEGRAKEVEGRERRELNR
jgi:uncharacterized protein YjbJ (UPF0337 family)